MKLNSGNDSRCGSLVVIYVVSRVSMLIVRLMLIGIR